MIRIYTDGACSGNPGIGGYSVIVNDEKTIKAFCGGQLHTTNNCMELRAVYSALLIAKKYKKETIILTDSAYVANAIKNRWVDRWSKNGWRNKKGEPISNLSIWYNVYETLCELEENDIKVSIEKVKGHSGDTFNDLADEYAKRAIKKAREGVLRWTDTI